MRALAANPTQLLAVALEAAAGSSALTDAPQAAPAADAAGAKLCVVRALRSAIVLVLTGNLAVTCRRRSPTDPVYRRVPVLLHLCT